MCSIVQCEAPALQPLPCEAGEDDSLYMECPHCNVVAVSRTNWEGIIINIVVVVVHVVVSLSVKVVVVVSSSSSSSTKRLSWRLVRELQGHVTK